MGVFLKKIDIWCDESISEIVTEALWASWCYCRPLLLTFLNLTSGGEIGFLGHTDENDNHFHNLSNVSDEFTSFFCSETGDQRDSWEAGGEGGRRRTVLLHCRGRQPCSWGEKNKCSFRHLGLLPGHHNGHSKFPGPLFPHIIIVRFSISFIIILVLLIIRSWAP